jgi:hypothetical protein
MQMTSDYESITTIVAFAGNDGHAHLADVIVMYAGDRLCYLMAGILHQVDAGNTQAVDGAAINRLHLSGSYELHFLPGFALCAF